MSNKNVRITRREFLKISAAAGASAFLASCAPKATPTVSLPDLSTGESIPLDQLVEAAKMEGELTTIALPHDWANYGEMLETFKAKYGLKINELNPDAGSGDELEAIRANKESKGPQAPDVVDIGLGFVEEATNEGLLAKYKVATWDTIPNEVKHPDGYWYGDYYGVLVFEGNLDVVKEMPQDWEDLLKPDYKNMVATAGDPTASAEANFTVWAAGLSRTGKLDDEAAWAGLEFFAELNKAGNFLPVTANTSTIAKGETPLTFEWDYLALANRDQYAGNPPLGIVVPKTGVVAGPYAQGISAYAPHPYAARLWQEFMYSDEGQLIFLKGYAYPIRYNDLVKRNMIPEDLAAKLPPAEDVARAVFPTVASISSAKKIIAENWRKIVLGEG